MSTTVVCRVCGASSTDPQWCSRCGTNLAVPAPTRWLDVGSCIVFKDFIAEALPPPPPGAVPTVSPDETPKVVETSNETPSETPDIQQDPAPVPLVDPFELIGGEPAADTPPPQAPEVEPPDPPETETPEAETIESEPPEVGLHVEVTAPKAAYSKRRIWLAESVPERRRFLLEERQGAPPASKPPDALDQRFLLQVVARQAEGNRTLTLRAQPKGFNLQQWRDDAYLPPSPEQIYKVIDHLLAAFEEIHAQGALHLRLCPDQTWVSEEGEVTFSECEHFERAPVEGLDHLRARLGYSAPELFGHGRQAIDARSDVYSLGAVLYFLIAGRRPPVSADTGFSPALPPRDFRPDFPVGWSDIVLVAMAPTAAHRFASATELREAVRAGVQQMRQRASYSLPLRLEAYVERHIGFAKQKRSPVNQDQVFLGQDPQRDRLLVVVADGVSTATYGSGDLASSFIAKRAEEAWQRLELSPSDPNPQAIISDIIRQANRDVSDYINQHHGPLDAPPSEVMGSTALIAYISQGQMTLGSLGDSRCYLIRDDVMECLTRDHNLFTLSLIEGLSLEHALVMPHGDALARCLGTFDVDGQGVLLPQDPPIDIYTLRLIPGDHILLCTDGLFDYAGASYEESEENIRQHVLSEEHPGIACLELILMANRGGGGDNIGIGLIKVSDH